MALAGFKGLMRGMDWRMAQMRKYMLAYRLNWMMRERGRKVMRLYLVVDM